MTRWAMQTHVSDTDTGEWCRLRWEMQTQVRDAGSGEPQVIVSQLIYRVRCDHLWITTGWCSLNFKNVDILNIAFQSYQKVYFSFEIQDLFCLQLYFDIQYTENLIVVQREMLNTFYDHVLLTLNIHYCYT